MTKPGMFPTYGEAARTILLWVALGMLCWAGIIWLVT